MEQFERMKVVCLAALWSVAIPLSVAAQTAPDKVGQAYAQFLIGHHLEDAEDADGAIAAYKRAIELDPSGADATADLAALYLHLNKFQEALTTAEQALKTSPENPEANRVMGIVYADRGRERPTTPTRTLPKPSGISSWRLPIRRASPIRRPGSCSRGSTFAAGRSTRRSAC